MNACLRRRNHKKRKIIQPLRRYVNCSPAFGFCPGLRIAGHELKITADAGTQRGKIEFTDSRRQSGGIIAHVKAPLRIRGKMNNLEVTPSASRMASRICNSETL